MDEQQKLDEQKLMDENANKVFYGEPAGTNLPLSQTDAQMNFNNSNPPSPLMRPPGEEPVNSVSPNISNIGSNAFSDANKQQLQMEASKPVAAPQAAAAAPQQASVVEPTGPSATAGYDMMIGGAKKAEEAGKARAQAEESYFNQKNAIQQKELDDAKAQQTLFDADWDAKTKDYENTVAEMKQLANNKVYPGDYLARQDTSGAVATGIAVALGAFAATAAGTTQNLGIEMVNKAIDRDIDAQKFNIEKAQISKKYELESKNTLLSRMQEKYKNDVAAQNATRAAMLEMAESKMKEQLAKTVLPLEAKAAGMSAIGQITTAKLISQANTKAALMQQQATAGTLQGADITQLNDSQLNTMEGVNKGFRDRYVPGYGPAANKFLAEDFQKINSEYQPALDSISRLKDLTKGFNKVTDMATRRQIEVERQALVGALRMPFTGPGILNEGERAMLEKIIGDPSKLLSLSSIESKSLEQVQNKIESDQKKRIKAAGLIDSKSLQKNKAAAKLIQ